MKKKLVEKYPKIPVIDVKKYGGKHIAIVNEKIVVVGRNSKEVLDKAKKLFPRKTSTDILLFFVPPKADAYIYVEI